MDFLGPISPELVLVDPELAGRARGLLPELPGAWRPGLPETLLDLPAPTPLRVVPHRRRGIDRRVASWVVAATVVLAGTGTGWWAFRPAKPAPELAVTRPPASAQQTIRPRVPTVSSQAGDAVPTTTPRFVWPSRSDAVAYRVALFQDGRKIFEEDVQGTTLDFPQAWTYGGKLRRLTAGTYRWVVWPLVGSLAGPRVGAPIVSASYTV